MCLKEKSMKGMNMMKRVLSMQLKQGQSMQQLMMERSKKKMGSMQQIELESKIQQGG